ncbi:unnamed protein product [Arctia plantaginis]|uniref:Uncharacterized protein n=1 Tax=Arctia plantaginis TaxID=874455 RepID=A0A8S1BP59_ARCPL|nr:unnamed protein product [Arctia plantaginis]
MFIPLRKTTARAPAICAVDTVIRDVQSTLVKFIIVLTQEGNVGSQIQTTLKKNACADAGKSVRSKSMTVSNNMSQAPQVVSTLTVIKKRMGIIQI